MTSLKPLVRQTNAGGSQFCASPFIFSKMCQKQFYVGSITFLLDSGIGIGQCFIENRIPLYCWPDLFKISFKQIFEG